MKNPLVFVEALDKIRFDILTEMKSIVALEGGKLIVKDSPYRQLTFEIKNDILLINNKDILGKFKNKTLAYFYASMLGYKGAYESEYL